jgi:hypothetical protein
MSRLSHLLLIALLGVLIAFPAQAAKKDKKKDSRDLAAAMKKKLSAAELPTDVREKADKALESHAAKLKEAQSKVDAVLTTEQKQARKTALKEAKNAGTKRRQAQSSIDEATKFTGDQKTKLAAAESELKSAQAALMKDLQAVLTPDQLAKAGLKAKKKNKA